MRCGRNHHHVFGRSHHLIVCVANVIILDVLTFEAICDGRPPAVGLLLRPTGGCAGLAAVPRLLLGCRHASRFGSQLTSSQSFVGRCDGDRIILVRKPDPPKRMGFFLHFTHLTSRAGARSVVQLGRLPTLELWVRYVWYIRGCAALLTPGQTLKWCEWGPASAREPGEEFLVCPIPAAKN